MKTFIIVDFPYLAEPINDIMTLFLFDSYY